MPEAPSARLGLVGPSPGDMLNLGDDIIRALVAQLDAVGAMYRVGPAADRGAASDAGEFFIATDSGIISVATGAAWIDVNPKDAAAGIASLRTLGPAATQAAPGNDARFPGGPTIVLADLDAAVQRALFQAGDIKFTARTAVPAGWLAFAGQTGLLKADYPDLWAVANTEHGLGNPLFPAVAPTTFALADLRGRAPIAAGAGPGLTARALGAMLGEEAHTLSGAESGVNGNGVTGRSASGVAVQNAATGVTVQNAATGVSVDAGGAHTHRVRQSGGGGGANVVLAVTATTFNSNAEIPSDNPVGPTGSAHGHGVTDPQHAHGITDPQHAHGVTEPNGGQGHSHALTARGADSAHNNMQPSVALTILVKT